MSRANINFESALEKIARIMARDYGINVVVQGNIAATDGNTIWLPMLEDVPEELQADLNGFLDHEVSHCKYTIFPELKKCKNRFHRELLNAVEDSRIEKLIIEPYPGCEQNLARLNAKWGEAVKKARKQLPWPIRLILAIRATYDGRNVEVDSDFEPLYLRIKDQAKALPKCKTTTALRIATAKMVDDINDERRKLAMAMPEMEEDCDDSEIVTETPIGLNDQDAKAKKKKTMGNADLDPAVKEEKNKKAKDKSEKSDEDDDEDSDANNEGEDSDDEGKSGDADGEGDQEGDDAGESEDEGDQGDSDADADKAGKKQGKGNEDQATGEEDNEPNHKGAGEGDDDDDESDEGTGKDKSDKSDDTAKPDTKVIGDEDVPEEKPQPKPLEKRRNYAKWVETDTEKQMMSEEDEAAESEYDKHIRSPESYMESQLKNEIKKQPDIQQRRYSGYYDGHTKIDEAVSLPISREFDVVNDYTNKGNGEEYAAAKREVMPLINPIKQQLERVLKVKENAHYKFNRERGAINARTLAQVVASESFRTPFKEFKKTDTSNVAVSLVIDQSGSMSGAKIALARKAALAIGESLSALGMAFEVTGFYTEGDRKLANMAAGMTAEESKRFNRFGEKLILNIFKTFDCPNLNGITKCHSDGANCDGESILWAAKRLAVRKEKRKIMLVFSDGQPSIGGANHEVLAGDLRRVIHSLPKAGISVVGFGINTDVVKLFYPDYVVVDDIKQLPISVMTKLAKILEKGIQ